MSLSEFTISPIDTPFKLGDIQLSDSNKNILNQLLKEFKHIDVLTRYGLPVDNKIFLFGHTGCGKTTTAKVIAQELGKKIIILNLGTIVSSKLGETSKNIAEVFQKAKREKAVLFLDEFDSIGRKRDQDDKDSPEMKRLVNTVIQFMDDLPNDALLIAATNHSKIIDSALLRRFQLKMHFELPNKKQLDLYYDFLLTSFPKKFTANFNRIYSISYAEAKDIALRAVKSRIIEMEESSVFTEEQLSTLPK